MVTDSFRYVKLEVWPRLGEILLSGSFLAGVAVGVGTYLKGEHWIAPKMQIGALIGALLVYVAVALAFSIAAMTLVICNPSSEIASYLAVRDTKDNQVQTTPNPRNSFSDLLFVFSWTAVIHWLFFIACIIAFVGVNSDSTVIESFRSKPAALLISMAFGLSAYCVIQFLVSILTLSSFGHVYILFLRKDKRVQDSGTPAIVAASEIQQVNEGS